LAARATCSVPGAHGMHVVALMA
jgi:hypothetical protein